MILDKIEFSKEEIRISLAYVSSLFSLFYMGGCSLFCYLQYKNREQKYVTRGIVAESITA
jgi:hypothetical protein